jgi:predicted site-specific integrase-resolvase
MLISGRPSKDLYIPKVCLSKTRELMASIGYARVSSTDQDFEAQVERLKAAGCDRVYSEKASGKSRNGRHALDKAIRALLPGDTWSPSGSTG